MLRHAPAPVHPSATGTIQPIDAEALAAAVGAARAIAALHVSPDGLLLNAVGQLGRDSAERTAAAITAATGAIRGCGAAVAATALTPVLDRVCFEFDNSTWLAQPLPDGSALALVGNGAADLGAMEREMSNLAALARRRLAIH
ncbi:hypothetical protein ACFC26_17285 [Kitasatospora purpeofusca]|uniref:hypothetical protein n=1 Tax=Kitasatospora purpeofusca TaxID=67352 RepID=UPI0035D7876C